MSQDGETDWKMVGHIVRRHLPAKKRVTNSACKNRWILAFLEKRPWSVEDDVTLSQLTRNIGPNWESCAKGMGRIKSGLVDRWQWLAENDMVDMRGETF